MSPQVERAYRRLLRAYPPSVRAERGEEILATLAEATPPDRRVPAMRESAALVVGGLRARARAAVTAGPAQVWVDGLYYGALLVTLTNVNWLLLRGWWQPVWLAALVAGPVALLRARLRLALVPLGLVALWAGWPMLALSGRFAAPAVLVAALALPGVRGRGRRGRARWTTGACSGSRSSGTGSR
jgi:hypothetical protein